MKITKAQLKQIIKEELSSVLCEEDDPMYKEFLGVSTERDMARSVKRDDVLSYLRVGSFEWPEASPNSNRFVAIQGFDEMKYADRITKVLRQVGAGSTRGAGYPTVSQQMYQKQKDLWGMASSGQRHPKGNPAAIASKMLDAQIGKGKLVQDPEARDVQSNDFYVLNAFKRDDGAVYIIAKTIGPVYIKANTQSAPNLKELPDQFYVIGLRT